MLCPEVWNFEPPSFRARYKYMKDDNELANGFKKHYFNHFVSVTLPDTLYVPEDIVQAVIEDSCYYKAEKVFVHQLVNADFIKLFILNGKLTLLSVNTKIDIDNCLSVTPEGKLLLSISRQTYQELGIVGRPSMFSRKVPERYIIEIDLKDESLLPEKKNYQNITNRFVKSNIFFDVILSWEPKEPSICPSSIAAYLCSKSCLVKSCMVHLDKRHDYNVIVPHDIDACEHEALTEWLGAFTLQCDIPETCDGFTSSYTCPEPCQKLGQVAQIQFKGLIPVSKISTLISALRKFVTVRSDLCWASVHVQGFEDSIVDGQGMEHQFYQSGDFHFTFFMRPSAPTLTFDYLSATKMPSSVTRKKKKKYRS